MQEVWSSLFKLLNVLVFFQLKEERVHMHVRLIPACGLCWF